MSLMIGFQWHGELSEELREIARIQGLSLKVTAQHSGSRVLTKVRSCCGCRGADWWCEGCDTIELLSPKQRWSTCKLRESLLE